jgi:hypothetical protein
MNKKAPLLIGAFLLLISAGEIAERKDLAFAN